MVIAAFPTTALISTQYTGRKQDVTHDMMSLLAQPTGPTLLMLRHRKLRSDIPHAFRVYVSEH